MKNLSIKINIKGTDWHIFILSNASYTKRFGKDSAAITLLEEKQICFNKIFITPGIIRHELLHATVQETNIESANLDIEQLEEICASIVETQWNNFNVWAEQIINHTLKEKRNAN